MRPKHALSTPSRSSSHGSHGRCFCDAGVVSLPVVPFSRPYRAGLELSSVLQALEADYWQGDGPATARATALIEEITGARSAMLTTSCTHALEMASMLLNLGPGDEVVVPSFTFSSTASAVAIRGATPVFVDVRPDTLNIDVECVRQAVTPRTRAIYVVHYAGVAADMEELAEVATEHGLAVVEDNAHGLGATWRGQKLGTFGGLATQSFHATKNVTCGEGGALLVNDATMAERAGVIREKGTNRAQFLRGEVDKYTWVDTGSSYLPSDLLAALLVAQLERFDEIQSLRHRVWAFYSDGTRDWARKEGVDLMHVPEGAAHPAHIFYVMMPSHADQVGLLQHMRSRGVVGTFHYQPLHVSAAGRRFGRTSGSCSVTVDRSRRLVRLPLFAGMSDAESERVLEAVTSYTCDPVVGARD
jgi:dTDP-4-amino-4,6-dideoxygalactose transaminase